MHVVLIDMFLLGLLLQVSLLVLIQHHVFRLETLLCVGVTLVQHLQRIGGGFGVIGNEWLAEYVGRREHFISVLPVLLLPGFPLLLELLLLVCIVEMAIDRVIAMGLPVLLVELLRLPLHLIPDAFLMVLIVDIGDNIVLLLVVLQQFLLALDWKPHLPILEVVIGHLLIVNHVVGVTDGPHLASRHLFGVGIVRFEVHDVEVLLVLERLFLP